MLMNAPILLGIIAVIFGIAPLLLRSNAVFILLALCGGEVLARLVSQDVTQIMTSIITADVPMFSIVQIVLLLILPLLILIWYRKSVKVSMLALHIVPAAAAVLLCFMFVVAKLPYETQTTLQSSDLYELLKNYFGIAIAAGMAGNAVWFWLKKPKREKHDDKKHHK
jgi:hypothetical protein